MSCIAVLNAGSSSIKFALYADGTGDELLFKGQIEKIGTAPRMKASSAAGEKLIEREWTAEELDHKAATNVILLTCLDLLDGRKVAGVGHRVVHGGTKYGSPVRIDAGVMRQQFDQSASLGARFHHRPLHHLLADAAAAAAAGDADILDQAARGALRTQPRQDAELQAADDDALPVLRDNELDIRIVCEPLERREIGLRQRVLDPLAGAAEWIVRQHGDNDADILAARGADGDL